MTLGVKRVFPTIFHISYKCFTTFRDDSYFLRRLNRYFMMVYDSTRAPAVMARGHNVDSIIRVAQLRIVKRR